MSKPDGTQLQLSDSTDIEDQTVQLKLARYDSYRQRLRGLLARGNSSFPVHKVDWPCSYQGGVIMAAWAIGVDPIENATTFESEIRSAIARISRTKLNNMKRDEGKSSLGPYV